MGGIVLYSRVLGVVVNGLFLAVGVALTIGGLIVRFATEHMTSYIQGEVDALQESLSSSGFKDVNVTDHQIDYMVELFAIGMISCGVLIIIITVMGMLGAWFRIKILLIIYLILVAVPFLVEIILVGIIYGNPNILLDPMKDEAKYTIGWGYAGFSGDDIHSVGWNVIHKKFECCGVDSYKDFAGATNWKTDYTDKKANVTLLTPISCCKTWPSSKNYSCAAVGKATPEVNYMNVGCFDLIWNTIFGKSVEVALILTALLSVQAITILCSLVLIFSSDKTEGKVEPAPELERKPRYLLESRNEKFRMREATFDEGYWFENRDKKLHLRYPTEEELYYFENPDDSFSQREPTPDVFHFENSDEEDSEKETVPPGAVGNWKATTDVTFHEI